MAMKILVIGSPKRDALMGFDFLVAGLSRAGFAFDHYPNILTESYGHTGTYSLKFDALPISYPGYGAIVENLKKRRYRFIITTVSRADYLGGRHGVFSRLSRRLKYSLGSNKFKMGGTLVTDWLRQGIKLPPYAVVDDLDEPCIHPVDDDLLVHCALYFKRELPFNRFLCFRLFKRHLSNEELMELASKLAPTWISYDMASLSGFTGIDGGRPFDERDIDITFLGSTYASYSRQLLLPALERLSKRYKVVSPSSGRRGKEEFYDILKRSKINISMDGRGWDAPKHYELPLCGGLLFLARPTIELAAGFKDGVNCVFIDNHGRDVERLADYYLENMETGAAIAGRGHELAKNELGCDMLARYVVRRIEEVI